MSGRPATTKTVAEYKQGAASVAEFKRDREVTVSELLWRHRHEVHVPEVSICRYRPSRAVHDRAVEAGVFEVDAKLELVDGDPHAMTPEGSRHANVTNLVADCLPRVFDFGFHARGQDPLAVGTCSESLIARRCCDGCDR